MLSSLSWSEKSVSARFVLCIPYRWHLNKRLVFKVPTHNLPDFTWKEWNMSSKLASLVCFIFPHRITTLKTEFGWRPLLLIISQEHCKSRVLQLYYSYFRVIDNVFWIFEKHRYISFAPHSLAVGMHLVRYIWLITCGLWWLRRTFNMVRQHTWEHINLLISLTQFHWNSHCRIISVCLNVIVFTTWCIVKISVYENMLICS